MEHTQEPWTFEEEGPPIVIEFDGVKTEQQTPPLIISIERHEGGGRTKRFIAQLLSRSAAPDARRIVACVNACEGIPTLALEETGGHIDVLYFAELREANAKAQREMK